MLWTRNRDDSGARLSHEFMIQFDHVSDLTILVAEPIEIGPTPTGVRRFIPIIGGEARGPKLRGKIHAGGADFQILRADGVTELHARYVLETDTGALVYIENSGLRHGPPMRWKSCAEANRWTLR